MFWAAITIGRLLATPIANRIPPAILTLVVMLGCLGTTALMAVLYWSPLALWILTAVFGLFMGPIFGSAVSAWCLK